ncbi:MAG: NAD(P)-dependent oxidoreductase [Rhodobacteraceae bacterium]|nr:NAD(P)-dependent oxidoreductase [Paracoccaceae bacterium]MCY4198175.1 NAD(P)-dependent oxidoreductase [Paracoccaceae bacterium]MCY4327692.1 NAD(P)-dependent oxidoreductase [Paracoccaceae bacterium]
MATGKMLAFVELDKKTPEKRPPDLRTHDFQEIYDEYGPEVAERQAGRCSQCGVPYCQTHCPLHNNIPDWLRLTAEGRLREAYELSQQTNSFPEICGRICPQDRLCEGNCVIEQSGHGTVTIGSVEKYLTEMAWEEGWVQPISSVQQLDYSVGIIGSGPGGLAAAEQLLRAGAAVTIYERNDRPGGLMTYGIPGFKLEKHAVMRRTRQIEDGGAVFVLNCEVGKDAEFSTLREQHDALLIATGVYRARELDCPGVGLRNIIPALEFLTASNRKGLGDVVPEFDNGSLNAAGKRVVVIGGGDTAMDCVRTAVRQGAASVKCLYRRDRDNMPGSRREVANAIEEGVEFMWLTQPRAFVGESHVSAVRAARMQLGPPDATGRRSPEMLTGQDFQEKADLVIKALGFDPENLSDQWGAGSLEVTGWGTVKTNYRSHMTNLPNVWAVGDIVRGASLVVWAIRDGREAAHSILRHATSEIKAAA